MRADSQLKVEGPAATHTQLAEEHTYIMTILVSKRWAGRICSAVRGMESRSTACPLLKKDAIL